MTSKSFRIVAVVFTFTLSLVGCGGGSETTVKPAATSGDSKPKAPPVKGKGGKMIESEENTPKRLQGRDN